MLTRRSFLASTAWTAVGIAAARRAQPAQLRKKVAFLGTEVRQHSHAQHFLDRLTLGYSWDGQWIRPRVDVAGVYIDQFPDGDLAQRESRGTNCDYSPRLPKR